MYIMKRLVINKLNVLKHMSSIIKLVNKSKIRGGGGGGQFYIDFQTELNSYLYFQALEHTCGGDLASLFKETLNILPYCTCTYSVYVLLIEMNNTCKNYFLYIFSANGYTDNLSTKYKKKHTTQYPYPKFYLPVSHKICGRIQNQKLYFLGILSF